MLAVEGTARVLLVGFCFVSDAVFEPVAFFRVAGLRQLAPQLSNVDEALIHGAVAQRGLWHSNFLKTAGAPPTLGDSHEGLNRKEAGRLSLIVELAKDLR